MLTTAGIDFDGDEGIAASSRWTSDRLRASEGERAPHLACAEHGRRRGALSSLQDSLGPGAVRPVSSTPTHGACFIVTASHDTANAVSKDLDLSFFGAFPSALKPAPGLLQHSDCDSSGDSGCSAGRLSTAHGVSMRQDSVHGLMLELSPGADFDIGPWTRDLHSPALDLHETSFWSAAGLHGGEHLASMGGALRGREWSRAATVVHGLAASGETSPSDICSWGDLEVHQAAGEVLLVSGLDHLLYSGGGVGGASDEEATELQMACFMGLVSFFASRHEVLRVATWNRPRALNAAARANIQSGTVTDTPLSDAGLDGSGEVVQVVDSGLNETSCFFADEDGGQVEHGHYFEEVGSINPYFSYSDTESFSGFVGVFDGGDFTYDSSRRKVIQYIELIKTDGGNQSTASSALNSSYISSDGVRYPFINSYDFSVEDGIGHGQHIAGTIAGSTLSAADDLECGAGEVLGCAGGCIPPDVPSAHDDDANDESPDSDEDIDRLCPMHGCVGAQDDQQCLGDDVGETLSEHGGMARGAKIAVMDIFIEQYSYADLAGNGLWEACLDAGCNIHSNAYGADRRCELSPLDIVYDDFMYMNPENLLVFAAGNEGWFTDRDGLCTINSPGIAKNVLAVGSTSSGETRLTTTALAPDREVGPIYDSGDDLADIDTISAFSSYGPTTDGRIKPEVVAPGDEIYSADGNDDGDESCRISAKAGTSMASAVASGAAAMVRQYFRDSSFYGADVEARGFCDSGFSCEGFSASAATVKAMLINSANLMGGGSEPSSYRGFGRIHLEAGMPLNGDGTMALYVKDLGEISSGQKRSAVFEVDADAGLELRATLSWIDPAATSVSSVQLVNDLDLRVYAPNGEKFYMWAENPWDTVNVNERVIISAEDVEANGSGTWEVRVRARDLATESQSYSLVVTGAISPAFGTTVDVITADVAAGTDDDVAAAAAAAAVAAEEAAEEAAAASAVTGTTPFLLAALSALAAAFIWA
eukprot:g13496.t1